ncbi:MAG: NnrS family protein [Candidatus Saccharibacteria bacterium]|nr:NnrS family protein [Pseudorhodobacter sp.]
MTSSAEQMRVWTGPAILSYGFRPFFLFGSVWAALAMVLWVLMLSGHDVVPTAFDPVSWHAHEFLFGYLGAVLAGFLLTAVPNWTGRLPLVGLPLAALVALWVAGRVAVATSALLPLELVAVIDLAFPLVLLAVLSREVLAGRTWKNLPVLVLLMAMTVANGLYHLDAAQGGYPAKGIALRMGLTVAVLLISLIGGRIVPSFTRNWLAQRQGASLPAPFGRNDSVVLVLTAATLVIWIFWPEENWTAAACAVVGVAQTWRLSRWSGMHTGAEALVWVLHVGYAFVPLGFFAIAAGAFLPGMGPAAQHVWMAGAVGLMTLAVMTRASLGHTGRPLHATLPITAIYASLIVAVLLRFVSGALPEATWPIQLAACGWIIAFAGFFILYLPILAGPKMQRRSATANGSVK